MERRKMAIIIWGVFILLLVIAFLVWFFLFRTSIYTDDAYVEGNQVYITPLKEGFVTAIHTDDTFFVKKGDLLVELDKTDSLIALETRQKELANRVREVAQLFHQVFVYQAEKEIKEAEFIKAWQDYKHREDVISRSGVSKEDFEHAIAAFKASFYALWMTETLYDKALSMVQGTSISNHPLVNAASDALRNAWVQLYRCHIYAPVDGFAAQRKIQVGMWVKAGTPLLSVIPLDQIWINANFKETQLKHIALGQSATITSDFYGKGVIYHGRVIGLPGAAGNAFSLLPPENLSGNWIKIVQRLPIRIALDPEELEKKPLRIGLSMEVTVDTEDQKECSCPSPTYATTIYDEEECGDRELIEKIIAENMDPTLCAFFEKPLCIERKPKENMEALDLETLKNCALRLMK